MLEIDVPRTLFQWDQKRLEFPALLQLMIYMEVQIHVGCHKPHH